MPYDPSPSDDGPSYNRGFDDGLASARIDLDGAVAELVGVGSALADAQARLQRVLDTLAGITREERRMRDAEPFYP